MGKGPIVTIILVSLNNEAFIANCLRSVFATDYSSFNVVLVDNGSRDRTVTIAAQTYAETTAAGKNRATDFRVLRNNMNLGQAKGLNQGAELSNAEYVAFLDTDTECTPTWLTELVRIMELDPTSPKNTYSYLQ